MFEKNIDEDEDVASPSLPKSTSLPARFDELPIELASLTDRFVESSQRQSLQRTTNGRSTCRPVSGVLHPSLREHLHPYLGPDVEVEPRFITHPSRPSYPVETPVQAKEHGLAYAIQ